MQSLRSLQLTGQPLAARHSCSAPLAAPCGRAAATHPGPAVHHTPADALLGRRAPAGAETRSAPKPGRRAVAASAQLDGPAYSLPKAETIILELPGGKQIKLETGEIGRQANGAVMASSGETVVYATACCAPTPTGDGSFLPLTVNYAERFSAAGRTSGGFIKRDGRPRDSETLVSRLVDRPLRPMFAKGWANETQVLEWVLSYDGINEPEPLAIVAAAAALLISDIPLKKAVAGVRVGLLPGVGFVVNPTVAEMKTSRLDLMVAGTRDAILMIEGFCDFLTEEQMIEAVGLGAQAIASLCEQLEGWASKVGKRKRRDVVAGVPAELVARLRELVGPQLKEAYMTSLSKEVRGAAVARAQAAAAAALAGDAAPYTPLQISMALQSVESRVMRSLVLDEQVRADGRGVTDIRPITSRAGLLPRTHGSSLFTRGETQAICVTTLGTNGDALRTDSMRKPDGEDGSEGGRFYLQYHFPPSSVGETGRTGAPGRRELGHGELAQRALAPILPTAAAFPYTVRVESTITESNGSSSMASVCGGCLSMMDAGVPVSRPVAGIAMGLILEAGEGGAPPRHVVLSDILGAEDSLGDMDFKVAGDHDALTAFQMDIKVEGITLDIMASALAQAKLGRQHILRQMQLCNPPPAGALSDGAPRLLRMKMDPAKRGTLIGPGGRTLKLILQASGATDIDLDEGEEGQVTICAPGEAAAALAAQYVTLLTSDPEPGTIFRSKPVVSVVAFGCFVELGPGRQGLVHVSELRDDTGVPITDVAEAVRVGELVDVMVLSAEGGKLALSRRAVAASDRGEPYQARAARRPADNDGMRPGLGAGRGMGRGDRNRRF